MIILKSKGEKALAPHIDELFNEFLKLLIISLLD